MEAKTKTKKVAPIALAKKNLVAEPAYKKPVKSKAELEKVVAVAEASKPKSTQFVAENTRKWGTDLVEAGWIFLPSTLVLKRDELGMDAVDLNILLVLLQYWWKADGLPFPTKQTIAGFVGIDASNVRKRLAKLEAKGLVTRTVRPKGGARNDSNIYSFEGLIKKAMPLALELSGERRNSGAKSATVKARRAAAAKNEASLS
ncbi:helix-turn-helix domain-containing protein [Burkholderia sp. PAMC 26561]|uniref:helix-turn-helix domain-containing protein n=1 Tax=Burkholderia sp. PAMC 26561 TaxID=1795043 RepID=UPI00076B7FD8|nr:helix-turn-helix domain-containing protein [Burkholderia sp. PAMC 26561]AME28750.1 hypothetical protein AXG89_33695 [Burkholderia sp. PAMC 26561]